MLLGSMFYPIHIVYKEYSFFLLFFYHFFSLKSSICFQCMIYSKAGLSVFYFLSHLKLKECFSISKQWFCKAWNSQTCCL